MSTKVSKVSYAIKTLLGDLAHLRMPTVAASIVAVIVQLFPGVNLNGVAVAGILGGIGLLASFIENLVNKPTATIDAAIAEVAATPTVLTSVVKEVETVLTEVETVVKKPVTRKKKTVATATPTSVKKAS